MGEILSFEWRAAPLYLVLATPWVAWKGENYVRGERK